MTVGGLSASGPRIPGLHLLCISLRHSDCVSMAYCAFARVCCNFQAPDIPSTVSLLAVTGVSQNELHKRPLSQSHRKQQSSFCVSAQASNLYDKE